jgi:CRISPR-associated protein Csb2
MFAIAVELLCRRYTATYYNNRAVAEWPPHPARLFSAMTAAWADADDPDPGERAALAWLEGQEPPQITCSSERRRSVVTHFVPVNDPTALTRDVSRNFDLVEVSREALAEAESRGTELAVKRTRVALAKAEAKAIEDGRRVGRPTGSESAAVTAAVLEVLPDSRGKQGRTYPTVIPDDPAFWFNWPEAEPSPSQADVLDQLLARVARIGHSSTLVSCRVVSSVPAPTWVPGSDQGTEMRIRVPREGLIDRLEAAFEVHQGREPRTLPAAMIDYRQPSVRRQALPVPFLGGDWFVLGLEGGPLPATRTLDVARAVRGALLHHSDEPISFLSGHQQSRTSDGKRTPPLDRLHLAIAPLPSAGHHYSDGSILGVALILPSTCSDEERSALEQAIQAWSRTGFELKVSGGSAQSSYRTMRDYGMDRAAGNRPKWLDSDLSARRRTLTRGYWCRPARRWLTVTPIALDRFPGQLRADDPAVRDRAEAEAEAAVTRACERAGLPADPVVSIRLDAPLTGLPAAPAGRSGKRTRWYRQFPGYTTGDGTPRVSVHAEIEFAEPVRGPVLVGAGRYYGYGLCLPRDLGPEDSP